MKIFKVLILILCCISGVHTQDSIVIANITAIPLHINKVYKNVDVEIIEGFVSRISDHKGFEEIPDTYLTIDGTGKFLIPSFGDAHGHLPDSNRLELYGLMQLAHGVTSVRSMRGKEWHIKHRNRYSPTPTYYLGSPPVSRRQSYSAEKIDSLGKIYGEAGFDFVKVLSVADSSTFYSWVKSCLDHNLFLAGHCPRNIGPFRAAETMMFASIEHLSGVLQVSSLDELYRVIEMTKDRSVFHCPTMDWYFTGQVIEDTLANKPGLQYIATEKLNTWEEKVDEYYKESTSESRETSRAKEKANFDVRLGYLKLIYENGGLTVVSPDASGIYGVPGFDYQRELQHFSTAGIPPRDILTAASLNYAKMTERKQFPSWGTIKVGSRANLLILTANPLENINAVDYIETIIISGEVLSRTSILEKMDRLNQSLKGG
ncbi:hypothetical protein CEQ90_05815 [Lewinellaceae bacterium SD302]|nr:hypothetical protein CEQ90_05815 [Lewinellaceae bacterium SD302]